MYAAVADPACYAGSTVLRNIPGLTSQGALDRFETAATGRRFNEPLPAGRLSVTHYRAIHFHLFQDVYRWAGRSRRIRISKGESTFCYPENIDAQLKRVFGELREQAFLRSLDECEFAAGAAHFLAELNAIHAFRDGNGRTQLAFLAVLADQASYPLDLAQRLEPAAFLAAMIASFQGREQPLADQIRSFIDKR